MPLSMAACMILTASFSSLTEPMCQPPRHSSDTRSPVLPRSRLVNPVRPATPRTFRSAAPAPRGPPRPPPPLPPHPSPTPEALPPPPPSSPAQAALSRSWLLPGGSSRLFDVKEQLRDQLFLP